ncbi:WhiB family transcriptional regulator [Nocardioides insulae]|uniref:WhiB family transcriptional regulator n=1 Tax=Nocardioides insulae TaxID=394734 RepID=UPI00048DCA0C|nr:WhiB family transcriptional regulator [Nocardioides insulae]
MWVNDWTPQAKCRAGRPDDLFVQGADQHRAKAICHGCPVRAECLAEALDNGIEWGVWGGMTERERRALLRQRTVDSWSALFQEAQQRSGDPLGGRLPSAAQGLPDPLALAVG